jgi:hypothetical protein
LALFDDSRDRNRFGQLLLLYQLFLTTAREEATNVGLLTSKRQSVLQPHSSKKDNEQTLWLGLNQDRGVECTTKR